ncbi:hypothetical protein KC973_00370 [Candidatus Saccharibacteria bacterium]|nr:hypothetical protein [Candidatus Saccharibacteria bacterium]
MSHNNQPDPSETAGFGSKPYTNPDDGVALEPHQQRTLLENTRLVIESGMASRFLDHLNSDSMVSVIGMQTELDPGITERHERTQQSEFAYAFELDHIFKLTSDEGDHTGVPFDGTEAWVRIRKVHPFTGHIAMSGFGTYARVGKVDRQTGQTTTYTDRYGFTAEDLDLSIDRLVAQTRADLYFGAEERYLGVLGT